jgi:hypothetical protein
MGAVLRHSVAIVTADCSNSTTRFVEREHQSVRTGVFLFRD